MPLNLYRSIYDSGSVPEEWKADRGGAIKYPVRNAAVLRTLRNLCTGSWQKVIKAGDTGEVHYFEHSSGQVADVKFFPKHEDL